VDCYNIFITKSNLPGVSSDSINNDFLNALIKFYYIHHIFDYQDHKLIDEKYLIITGENKSPLDEKNIYITDNMRNDYIYYWSEDDKDNEYIAIVDSDTDKIYYISNTDRTKDPYIYANETGTIKSVLNTRINCFYDMVSDTNSDTRTAKEYLDMLTLNDADWVSKIRQKIIGISKEPFKGGKKNNNKNKKNKRTNRKNKNKGGRRIRNIISNIGNLVTKILKMKFS
jgi:hypothetical protein